MFVALNGQAPGKIPWFRREPIDLGEVTVEIIAVVLGVLIAMAIGRWHEQNRDKETIDSALRAVRLELEHNLAVVGKFATRLETMSEQMRALNVPVSEAPESGQRWGPCMSYEGWAGFVPPMLLDTAYEVAIATEALAKMPFNQASSIGRAYGTQRYIQKIYDKTGDLLFAIEPRPLGLCTGLTREMAKASQGLVVTYAEILKALPKPAET